MYIPLEICEKRAVQKCMGLGGGAHGTHSPHPFAKQSILRKGAKTQQETEPTCNPHLIAEVLLEEGWRADTQRPL